MMNISVKSVHFNVDVKLVDYIEKKLGRLNRYFDRPAEVNVLLKLQDTGAKIQDKITEIHIQLPGSTIIDKKTDKSFEAAVDASYETLKRRMVQLKEKEGDHKSDIK